MRNFFSVFSQSSLVPLAKIANAPSRTLRLLWAAFTAAMFMSLCICITLVVIQYCRHQTVFQLDYSGRQIVYDQIPGFTICPQAQEAQRMVRRAIDVKTSEPIPWNDKVLMDQLRHKVRLRSPNHSFHVISHRLPIGELYWNTWNTAMSPIYQMLHNFSVHFRMQPPHLAKGYRLTVMEQVPNGRTFLCTTFELRPRSPTDRWSYLEIEIDQPGTLDNVAPFTIITHERGELPFSAYDRHIHTVLPANTVVSVYFSKSVTARLNTARNPCHEGPDAKSLAGHHAESKPEMLSSDMRYAESLADSTVESEKQFIDPLEPSVSHSDEELDESQWHVDMLDRLHFNMSSISQVPKHRTFLARKRSTKPQIVSLFGTTFLYSREACGWAECCRKVAQVCNCICNINTLVHNTEVCKAGPVCEIAECREKQISYTVCPLPCIMTKFIKHNEIRVSGVELNMSIGLSKLKLIRSEAVQVATEEEIFSLAKLFSEVGGLCSLFIGFSCIFVFELLEALILMHKNNRGDKRTDQVGNTTRKISKSGKDSTVFQNLVVRTEQISNENRESNAKENGRIIENVRVCYLKDHGQLSYEDETSESALHRKQINTPEDTHNLVVTDNPFNTDDNISQNDNDPDKQPKTVHMNFMAIGTCSRPVWEDDVLVFPISLASSDCLPDRTGGSMQAVPNSASRSTKIPAGQKQTRKFNTDHSCVLMLPSNVDGCSMKVSC
ncbi:hypothetical protein P879_05032 [Paragonimus westermani]|uniref:Amiloride-sensitive sodium channel n=1 Tax=Paragonimus westermani TaxID=34504 RepID=A0A8T0DDA4_9TREM|nr:hypothetical protein P879_05032 [Paragonimus westermani]